MTIDAIGVTILVTQALEKTGVPYFIGGSLASTFYGMVRTTQDSDIIADLKTEHIPFFLAELNAEFFIDDQMIVHAIERHSSFNLIHRESMFKVDVFVPKPRAFITSQFSRARKENLSSDPQVTAYVTSPEDILLAKLEWYRMGGEVSERQWRDVLGVLKIQAGVLDLDYLHRMGRELQVDDLVGRALSEAGLS